MQNYNIRFRRAFNDLQHSITNEYKNELTRQVMNDRLNMDSVTDYVRGLRSEIGQLLLVNPPPNIIAAEQRAMDVERYFREDNARKRMTRQTTAPPPDRTQTSCPIGNRFTITNNTHIKTPPIQNIQPRTTFRQSERAPLTERAQLRCFKCNRLGHTSNQCSNFRTPSLQQRAPPINNIEMETEESGSMQLQENSP